MIRKFYLSVFFLCSLSTVSSQVKGIKFYATGNYFWLESKVESSLFDEPVEVKFENGDNGFDIGYGLLYQFNSRIDLGTDLNYSDRYRNEFDPWGTQQTVKYIGLHQKIFFNLGKVLKPYTGIGFNYLILKRSSADIDFESTRSLYSNLDMALQFGIAFRIKMFELFSDFHYGLNPQRKIVLLEDFTTEIKVNSKSRLLRVGLSYIIEPKDTPKEEKRKKKKRRRR